MTFSFHSTRRRAPGLWVAALVLSGLSGTCGSAHGQPATPPIRRDLAPIETPTEPAMPAHSLPSRIGMANPASLYCERRGGRVELRPSAQGTTGWCHLPDGTVMEEWELFRRTRTAPATPAAPTPPAPPTPIP